MAALLASLAAVRVRWFVFLILWMIATACSLWLVPQDVVAVRDELAHGHNAASSWLLIRPYILGAIFFIPAVASLVYCMSSVLSRWLWREFLNSLALCGGAVYILFFLIDFSTHIEDLNAQGNLLINALEYYGKLLPGLLVTMMPIVILFAALHCISKVCKSREIVAALQSGRSLWHVLSPFYICGFFLSIMMLGFNYHWALDAQAGKFTRLAKISGKSNEQKEIIYFYGKGNRFWRIGDFSEAQFSRDEKVPIYDVDVIVVNQKRELQSRIQAPEAYWTQADGWHFVNAVQSNYRKGEAPLFTKLHSPFSIKNWHETPVQIAQFGLSAEDLGLPALTETLATKNDANTAWQESILRPYQTQWHYRLAQPWINLIYIGIAVPAAFYITRRTSGIGILIAIISAVVMILCSNVFLALGESGDMKAGLSVWIPMLLYAMLAIILLWRRSKGLALWN